MDARRAETCVTPNCVARRHVDASRDFTFYAARLFLSVFLVQQTMSGIGRRVK